ncbi:MAG: DNA repair protein RecO [Candidatus Omnitrophica bacterium]|nr:DNA repair protein RecO [Candidatus Omnitrophota bacterium]
MTKTLGIILRCQEVRETSVLLTAYTQDLGKIRGLMKGVRGGRAAVPWYLEPLSLQSMVIYERRRSPVSLIGSLDLLDAFEPVRRDLTRIAHACSFLERVEAMTEVLDPHPEIFHLLRAVLRAMGAGADPRSMARFLEVHLLRVSGLLPEAERLPLSPGGLLTLKQITSTALEKIASLRMSGAIAGELAAVLRPSLEAAAQGPLKSQSFLKDLNLEALAA